MRIIIIGAGLGGLAAAFCFARKGHDVKVQILTCQSSYALSNRVLRCLKDEPLFLGKVVVS